MATLIRFYALDRNREASTVGTTSVTTADLGIMSKRGVRLKAAQGPVYPQGTAAYLTVGTVNAQVKVTAKYGGVWANTYVQFAIVISGASTPFSIVNTYASSGVLTITVNGQTNSGSTSVTTALQAVAAINADPLASQFVTASVGTGTGASVIVAGAATALANGVNNPTSLLESTNWNGQPTFSEPLYVRATNQSLVICDITDGPTARIIRRERDRLVPIGPA